MIHTAYNKPSPNAIGFEYRQPSPSALQTRSNSRPRKTLHRNISSSLRTWLPQQDPSHEMSISCSTWAAEVNRRHSVVHPSIQVKADGDFVRYPAYQDSVASLTAYLNPPLPLQPRYPDCSSLPRRRLRCSLHFGWGQIVHHLWAMQKDWINVRFAVIAVGRGFLGCLFVRR